jgi:hypothetical protein
LDVPSCKMDAPMTGSPVDASNTVPVAVTCAGSRVREHNVTKKDVRTSLLFLMIVIN